MATTSRKVHLFWMGAPPIRVWDRLAEWREYHPTELYTELPPEADLLYRETLPFLEVMDDAKHASNIFRYWILQHEGGIYADVDLRPLRVIDLPYPFVLWSDIRKRYVLNGLMGFEPGHPLHAAMLKAIDDPSHQVYRAHQLSGVTLMAKVIQDYDVKQLSPDETSQYVSSNQLTKLGVNYANQNISA